MSSSGIKKLIRQDKNRLGIRLYIFLLFLSNDQTILNMTFSFGKKNEFSNYVLIVLHGSQDECIFFLITLLILADKYCLSKTTYVRK